MTSTEKNLRYDIVIIGAGPAGLAFSCSIADTGLRILLIESKEIADISEPAADGRDIALTHLSKKLLQQSGAWERIPEESIHPIRKARVLDGTSPYCLDFDSDSGTPGPLGFLVANHRIRKAIFEQAIALGNSGLLTGVAVDTLHTSEHGATIHLSDGQTVRSSLVVAADSRFSTTRRKMGIPADMHDFGRVAIVCRMDHELAHDGIAYECFHYGRTLAVLPLTSNQSSIVITVHSDIADDILGMDESRFNSDIQKRFGNRLGRMQLTGKRYPYPLVAVHARKFVATRFAVIGDAAVGMHPVTAHGFNLGLRGQNTLAECIRSAVDRGADIAAAEILEQYQSTHMHITRPLYRGTNGIVGLFTDDRPHARILRKIALGVGKHLPPVRRMITNQLTETDPARNVFLRLPF